MDLNKYLYNMLYAPIKFECYLEFEDDEDNEEVEEENDPIMWGVPDVLRILYSPPATIVFWEDGTKTVVKCMEGEKFDKCAGFAMACMKKMFGSTSRFKAIIRELGEETVKAPKDNVVCEETLEENSETSAE